MSEKEKPCMTCKKACKPLEKNLLKSLLSDKGGTVFSSVNPRPNSKAHTVIMTKRHTEDLRTLTDQEWVDILPVLKDSIAKIENRYKWDNKPGPLGYRVAIPLGEGGSQNEPFHFYCRIVPKFKKNWGTLIIPDVYKKQPLDSERAKNQNDLRTALQPNPEKVVSEKSKILAKLHDGKEIPTFAVESLPMIICISGKNHLPNDIQAIDQETWNEIGQMLKELMAKIEKNTNCHSFQIDIILGEEAARTFQDEFEAPNAVYPASEFVVRLLPRYKATRWWCNQNRPIKDDEMMGSMENERIATKFREPERYDKIWGKKHPQQEKETIPQTKTIQSNQEKESLWKQPTLYWGLGGGLLIAGLGMGIYYLVKKKK